MFAGNEIVRQTFKKEAKVKERYIKKLNNLPLMDNGFIYKNYCMGSRNQKQYSFNYHLLNTIDLI